MRRRLQAWAVPASLATTGGILVSFFSFVVLVILITRPVHKEPRGHGTSTVAPSHAQTKQAGSRVVLLKARWPFKSPLSIATVGQKRQRVETLGRDSPVACTMCTGRSSTERLKARQVTRYQHESPLPPPQHQVHAQGSCGMVMILPQVHLRKPCYDFYFL